MYFRGSIFVLAPVLGEGPLRPIWEVQAAQYRPVFFGAGPLYLAGAASGGGYFLLKGWRLSREQTRKTAMAAFFASLVQLSLVLVAATLDGLLR